MSVFKLPDLGEGLQEAEIRSWLVREGDSVQVDQPLVSVETAKAVVELPSPRSGRILRLFGQAGDICRVGEPLVEFAESSVERSSAQGNDNGTVVGRLESELAERQDHFYIGAPPDVPSRKGPKATPQVRALAHRLGVSLTTMSGSGPQGQILKSDVEAAATEQKARSDETPPAGAPPLPPFAGEPLHGVRRQMALNLAFAHSEVAAVTLWDDVDVEDWPVHTDVSVLLIQALVGAAKVEPNLNAWYDSKRLCRLLHQSVHVGIATDTPEGLFVPVLRDADRLAESALRQQLDDLHRSVLARTLDPEAFQGATLTLSNFGALAGRYATPLIVPPTVCILGAGKIRTQPAAFQGQLALRRVLPLSLTFDHRAVTGAEAARFLQALMQALGKPA